MSGKESLYKAVNLLQGDKNKRNYKDIIELASDAAKAGIVDAMVLLGNLYFYGEGVGKDLEKAQYWYRSASDLVGKNNKDMIVEKVVSTNCRDIKENLKGFWLAGKIQDWRTWINKIPLKKGVYAIIRENTTKPKFLKVGTGGFFHNEDPNVEIEVLTKKWNHDGGKILYIGRANYDTDNPKSQTCKSTLQKRVKAYMNFGEGKKVGHRGGRYIWQIEDSGEFCVWYKVCDYPQKEESELIKKFKPFANLKDGNIEL